jgi:DNA (cytosine-5)-methyltransferase 1
MASGQANAEVRVDGGAPTLTCLHEAPIAVQALHPEVAPVCGTLSDGAHHGGGLNGQDAHTGRILPVTYHAPAIGAFAPSDVAGTLMRHNGAGPGETQNAAYVQTEMAVRRLTPRECERLMGFPDDFTLVPYKGKPAHDGGRYKALGNSIAVNCLRWVGQRIALVDKTWGVP